jgi:uncharacterized membrane protein YdbT with pleckstrin-like domain
MSYVQRVLQPGEVVRYVGSLHWMIYLPGLIFMLAALVTIGWAELGAGGSKFWEVVAALFAIVALGLVIPEWFTWWTTEIAVTNHRIIYKTGLIRRDTFEMMMDKVESVDVDQSILGRFLDFGDVTVRGTGTGFEPLLRIAHPIELRNHITGVGPENRDAPHAASSRQASPHS